MTSTPAYPALVELITRLEGKDKKTCELALYVLKRLDKQIAKRNARITELERVVDAFHADPDNLDARVLRYKLIASKAINEQVEIREKYDARIAELEALLKECADDLDAELNNRYGNVHPAMQKRYDMDMAPVRAARAALEKKND